MKRDPTKFIVFYGTEVENTSAKGLATAFVAGYASPSVYLKQTQPHIYFAANQSYEQATTAQWLDLVHRICPLCPDKKFTIDVPAAHLQLFLSRPLPENLLVQVSLMVPLAAAPQVYLKLDDNIQEIVNNGVWVAPLTILQTEENFTPWSAYSGDTYE